ncbi:DUF421 domain-containing protein [Paracoccus suum]|uniref:DUF421 domain-containing protein n=1 Tax=Paracoccus suum TaxID=2259340 RepID=A0A344PIQ9_9RHOB|nr:YetF domain-containing protein [Paracoccus suum]AXC49264.1 DUF421 domain-containing protein [Paracoccus suum]
MDSPVTPFDLQRMFLGDYPPLYYAEVAFRVVVIYGYTLALIRWVGGRGIAQLSMVELLLVIALGSAVGDAMFYDDVPLLVAMWVITLVVLVNKALDKLIVQSRRAEAIIDGHPLALVRDGALVNEGLAARDLGTNEVKAMLRCAGIANLGQVEHAYLETHGSISVFRPAKARPGLAIVPPPDVTPHEPLTDAGVAPDGMACCCDCGAVVRAADVIPGGACSNCGHDCWTAPVMPPSLDNLPES